jgi:hypothetical protein
MNGGDKRFSCMAADGNQVIGSHKRNTGPMLTSPRCPARPSRPMPRPEGGLRAAGIARRRQPSERADLGASRYPPSKYKGDQSHEYLCAKPFRSNAVVSELGTPCGSAAMESRCTFDRHIDTATERLEGRLELIQSRGVVEAGGQLIRDSSPLANGRQGQKNGPVLR